jgi:mono/diheme cytochrome c family protein
MMRRMRLPGFGLLSVLLVGGCSRAPEETAPLSDVADESTSHAGERIFQTRCFVCHGREGKGDGPASTGLGASVRDLTSPSWQDSTSDETIRSVIRNGAQAVGGSAAMTPNRDLSDTQIQSLLRYIRGLHK